MKCDYIPRLLASPSVGSRLQAVNRAELFVRGCRAFDLGCLHVAAHHLRRAPAHEDAKILGLSALAKIRYPGCSAKGMNPFEFQSGRLECAACEAEGVTLSDLLERLVVEGITWARVRTPTGIEGWASSQYLER
jgi:hypothetical protein